MVGDGERQLLADDERWAPALKHCGVKATLPLDRAGGGTLHHDQIADTAETGDKCFNIAELLRPAREATIETHPHGFWDVVAFSPVDKSVLCFRCRFQHLALDHLTRHSSRKDHVG